MDRVPVEIAVLHGARCGKAAGNAENELTTAGAEKAVLAGICDNARLQGFEIKQEDSRTRVGRRREQHLKLLEIGARPFLSLRKRERRIAEWSREVKRISRAHPGDVLGPTFDQLLDAGRGIAGRSDGHR